MSIKIGILMGGPSEEHEVSINTGKSVYEACTALGYSATQFRFENDYKKFLNELKKQDIIFNALHGGMGEDGKIQAWMDKNHIKYTGSGAFASALCMDKARAKDIARISGVNTPDWELLYSANDMPNLQLPLVIKPNKQGSTVGLTIVYDEISIKSAVEEAFQYGAEILVEKYVKGRELTVSIIGNNILPIVEILPMHDYYDYECKYTPGMSEYNCPADLDYSTEKLIKDNTQCLFYKFGCQIYGRADFILDERGVPLFLEMNTLPGMTSTSLVPKSALAHGMSFDELVYKIIKLSL